MRIMLWYLLDGFSAPSESISKLPTEEDFETPSPTRELSKFLKSSYSLSTPSVFSSDNSLLSCFTYGDDIYDLIRYTKEVADRLLLDENIKHDQLLDLRRITMVRSLFIGRDGSFPDVQEMLTELRKHTLRLSEGLELRTRNPELGVYTFKNLPTATMVFEDLDAFYRELYYEYRLQRTNTGNVTNRGR